MLYKMYGEIITIRYFNHLGFRGFDSLIVRLWTYGCQRATDGKNNPSGVNNI
jgi:hypothetical protein